MRVFDAKVSVNFRFRNATILAEREVDEITAMAAGEVAKKARKIVPVDTGALKASIKTRRERPMAHAAVASTHYAAFVEFGTVKMNAQPYMRPSVSDGIAVIRREAKRRVADVMFDAGK